MKAKELWNSFTKEYPQHKNAPYEAWAFGVEADQLAELTARGMKTATTSGYALYETENESLPKEKEFNIILDNSNEPVCVTQTTKVYIVPFNEVTEEHAFKEGEGDRSLDYWRQVHMEVFSEEYKTNNLSFSNDSLVVCEEFEVVFKRN